jgi:hypothetical protein
VGGSTLLYFAYNARISPDQMATIAPDAEFQFIAHLPEWGLHFSIVAPGWSGSLPAIAPTPGSTVWGAVYDVPASDYAALEHLETSESRPAATTIEAMDRSGRRHQVVAHLSNGGATGSDPGQPSKRYLGLMLDGSRHWNLPAGWIAGLEEHLENGV